MSEVKIYTQRLCGYWQSELNLLGRMGLTHLNHIDVDVQRG